MSDQEFEKPGADERVIRPLADDRESKRLCSSRIVWFTKHHLTQLAVSDGGWSKLFLDPEARRYWELNFPDGREHGGGTPELRELSIELAREKYGLVI